MLSSCAFCAVLPSWVVRPRMEACIYAKRKVVVAEKAVVERSSTGGSGMLRVKVKALGGNTDGGSCRRKEGEQDQRLSNTNRRSTVTLLGAKKAASSAKDRTWPTLIWFQCGVKPARRSVKSARRASRLSMQFSLDVTPKRLAIIRK